MSAVAPCSAALCASALRRGLLAAAALPRRRRPARRSTPSPPRPRPPRPAATPTSRPPSPSHNPGAPEAAQNVIFNAPEGVFGNPNAITHCTSSDFALDQCPSNSQAGLITVYANYEGIRLPARHRADLRPRTPGTIRRRSSPSSCRPSTSRSTSRSRCAPAPTTACASPSRTSPSSTPLAGADLTFWGFPADSEPRRPALPERRPRQPGRLPGTRRHQLHRPTRLRPASRAPADRQPDHLHRAAADHQPRRADLPGPRQPRPRSRRATRRPPTATRRSSTRSSTRARPPTRPIRPRASNIELSAPQFLGFAASPSEIKSAIVTLPPGFTINPDAADGQTRLHRRAGQLRHRGAGRTAPTTPRSAPSRSAPRRSPARSTAPSTSANRSPATSTASS